MATRQSGRRRRKRRGGAGDGEGWKAEQERSARRTARLAMLRHGAQSSKSQQKGSTNLCVRQHLKGDDSFGKHSR